MPYLKDEKPKATVSDSVSKLKIEALVEKKQSSFTGDTLTLHVKQSHFIGRSFLFGMSFLLVAGPLVGIIFSIAAGEGNPIYFVFLIGIMSLVAQRILRLALWNTYGKEIITFDANRVSYVVDYGWFTDKVKTIEPKKLGLSLKAIGCKEDNMGLLVIGDDSAEIKSAVKIPIIELEQLIVHFETLGK